MSRREQGQVAEPAAGGAGATRQIARHAATLAFDALPPALVELTKQCVLDTIGVTIGASGLAPEAKIVADYVGELGGRGESTILGFGGKAPAPWAVFANGSLGHMLDYDDLGGGHVSIATVPVVLAVAERAGGLSGRDLITAIAAGADVMTRLHEAIRIPDWTMTEGWFATQLLGYLGGAAAAGRALGLGEEAMDNALGIAFNQVSGSRQMAVGAATHLRSMQAGFCGQGAVLAADLARRGIIGSKEVLEGRYGLFRTYVRTNEPDWEAILGGLGTRFPLLQSHGFKVWPACGYTRPVNAALLELREKDGIRPEDVESITVVGGTRATQLLSEPPERKRRPQESIDGKYSIPFTAAVMMMKGTVTLRDYTREGLNDPAVLAMADRVHYRAESGFQDVVGGSSAVSRPTVEVRTRGGKLHSHKADSLPGDPRQPVKRAFLESKFRDCVRFSATPVPPANVDRAIEMIWNLEHATDATAIVRLLASA